MASMQPKDFDNRRKTYGFPRISSLVVCSNRLRRKSAYTFCISQIKLSIIPSFIILIGICAALSALLLVYISLVMLVVLRA